MRKRRKTVAAFRF